MSARHGGGPTVVAEPADISPNLKASISPDLNFVIYNDVERVGGDYARFDPDLRHIEFRDFKSPPSAQNRARFVRAEPYIRLFGSPALLPDKELFTNLGKALRTDGLDADSDTPVGYTYLGQFIFHDLTRMKSQVGFPDKPLSQRTPALDLDSVFDPIDQSRLSSASKGPSALMPIGRTHSSDLGDYLADLPRKENGCPLIADLRNDDLLPLAQIHMAVIRFYNAIVAAVGDGTEARALCQLHFQWIVLHDYLCRIIDSGVYDDVRERGRAIIHTRPQKIANPSIEFAVPLEFAAACARFGHTMVRSRYSNGHVGWNNYQTGPRLYAFWTNTFNSSQEPIKQLESSWIAQWHRLLSFDANGHAADAERPLMANRIGTRLAYPLAAIPREAQPPPDPPDAVLSDNLAVRSLERAHLLRLNSGQEIARLVNDQLRQSGRPVFLPLTRDELLSEEDQKALTDPGPSGAALVDHTPLWFYTLKEAAVRHGGERLGPLAGRIVMETVHAAIEEASPSIFDDGGSWRPDDRMRPSTPGRYTFPDLIRFAGLAGEPPRAP